MRIGTLRANGVNLISNSIKFTQRGEIRIRVFWSTKESGDLDDVDEEMSYIPDESYNCSSQKAGPFLNLSNSSSISGHFVDPKSLAKKEMGNIPTLKSEKSGILVFQVIDTGSGISHENFKNLFDKYAQFAPKEQTNVLGTGLGLWITKKIVDRLGADIKVDSVVDQGSTFSVNIPCTPCATKLRELCTFDSMSIVKNTPTAMIVEDNTFNAQIISNYLASFGIEVVQIAPNGLKAAEVYEQSLKKNKPIQIITMDLEMPVMGGIQASEKIRVLEEKYHIPSPATIVVISGNAVEAAISKCLNPKGSVRASHFIRKPAKRYELEQCLTPYLETVSSFKEDLILVVDDDHFNVQITQEILNKAGYMTIAAYNGQEAVEKYVQYYSKISLILMDCEMRIMDGFQATQKILSYATEKKVTPPMIYGLTGHVGKIYEQKCIEAGMKKMIKKPIGYNELLALVSNN